MSPAHALPVQLLAEGPCFGVRSLRGFGAGSQRAISINRRRGIRGRWTAVKFQPPVATPGVDADGLASSVLLISTANRTALPWAEGGKVGHRRT